MAFLMPWMISLSEISSVSDLSTMAARTADASSHSLCVFCAALSLRTTSLGMVEAIKLSNSGDLVHLQSGVPNFAIFFFREVALSLVLKAASMKALPASVRVKVLSLSSSLEGGSSSEISPSSDLGRFTGGSLPRAALSFCDRVAIGGCELEPPVAPLFRTATSV